MLCEVNLKRCLEWSWEGERKESPSFAARCGGPLTCACISAPTQCLGNISVVWGTWLGAGDAGENRAGPCREGASYWANASLGESSKSAPQASVWQCGRYGAYSTLGLMLWAFGFCWPRTVRVAGNGTSLSSKRGPKFWSLTRSKLSSDPVVNTLVGPGNATYFTLCDLHWVIPLPTGCVESVLNEGEVGRLALRIRD